MPAIQGHLLLMVYTLVVSLILVSITVQHNLRCS